ncbi:hypothetical protein J6590_009557 [Homalodisca vitripennis]|nr:hypothetical protein J6590_009557 [Homalodisca vitripennis]
MESCTFLEVKVDLLLQVYDPHRSTTPPVLDPVALTNVPSTAEENLGTFLTPTDSLPSIMVPLMSVTVIGSVCSRLTASCDTLTVTASPFSVSHHYYCTRYTSTTATAHGLLRYFDCDSFSIHRPSPLLLHYIHFYYCYCLASVIGSVCRRLMASCDTLTVTASPFTAPHHYYCTTYTSTTATVWPQLLKAHGLLRYFDCDSFSIQRPPPLLLHSIHFYYCYCLASVIGSVCSRLTASCDTLTVTASPFTAPHHYYCTTYTSTTATVWPQLLKAHGLLRYFDCDSFSIQRPPPLLLHSIHFYYCYCLASVIGSVCSRLTASCDTLTVTASPFSVPHHYYCTRYTSAAVCPQLTASCDTLTVTASPFSVPHHYYCTRYTSATVCPQLLVVFVVGSRPLAIL